MTWFVARNKDGSLASIHRDHMAGYNDEQLADNDPAVIAFTTPKPSPPTPASILANLTAAELAALVQSWTTTGVLTPTRATQLLAPAVPVLITPTVVG